MRCTKRCMCDRAFPWFLPAHREVWPLPEIIEDLGWSVISTQVITWSDHHGYTKDTTRREKTHSTCGRKINSPSFNQAEERATFNHRIRHLQHKVPSEKKKFQSCATAPLHISTLKALKIDFQYGDDLWWNLGSLVRYGKYLIRQEVTSLNMPKIWIDLRRIVECTSWTLPEKHGKTGRSDPWLNFTLGLFYAARYDTVDRWLLAYQ